MNRLTLAMIVRDEARRLPDFLTAHAGLFDELVVVDTGSGDETPDLVREAGGVLISAPWRDDFAEARNAGLEVARGDWILCLDADERISRSDFEALRRAMAASARPAYLQETWNYCRGTTHLEWQPLAGSHPVEEAGQTGRFVARRLGLFPNDARIRFRGRVHESVLPAVEAAGIPVASCPVPVHHYGYVGPETANDARVARYQRLVELKFKEDPADPAARLEWATVLLEAGEPEAAREHLVALGKMDSRLRPVARGLVLHGRLRRESGEPDAARDLLERAVKGDPDFVFGWLELIRLAAEAEDWQAAAEQLRRAESRFGSSHPQLLREALRIQVKNHDLVAALSSAEELVRSCPQWQEIRALRDRLRRLAPRFGKA